MELDQIQTQHDIPGDVKTSAEIARDQGGLALEQARAEIARTAEQPTEEAVSEEAFETIAIPALPMSGDMLPSVQTALNSENGEERAGAARAVLQFVTLLETNIEQKQSVDTMMTALLKQTQAARRHYQLNWLSAILGGILLLWLIIFTRGSIFNFWWAFPGTAWAIDKTARKRRETAGALGLAGDPRAVGVLAVVVRDGDRTVRRAANGALLALLPRVRADHAAFITADQMNALLELGFRSQPGMQISVLKALEQVGDQRAIPMVENLVLSPHHDVRAQARQCLPFLIERARRSEQRATLLRGAANPGREEAGKELLRAAATAPETTPADQLLRPAVTSITTPDTTK